RLPSGRPPSPAVPPRGRARRVLAGHLVRLAPLGTAQDSRLRQPLGAGPLIRKEGRRFVHRPSSGSERTGRRSVAQPTIPQIAGDATFGGIASQGLLCM